MNYKACVCAGAMQTHRYATSSKEAKPNTTTRRLSSLEQKYFSKVSSGIRKCWQMPPLSFKPFTINAKRHWV